MSVPVTRDIQPVVGAMLPVSRTRQQPVYYFFICVRGPIRHERLHLLWCGRQARKIVCDTSNERRPVSLFRGRQSFLRQPAQDKTINRVSRPLTILRLRNRWAFRCNKGPVFLVDRTFLYPPAQQRDLFWFEGPVTLRRRHSLFWIARLNSPHQRMIAGPNFSWGAKANSPRSRRNPAFRAPGSGPWQA